MDRSTPLVKVSWLGRAAAAVFLLNTALLFFPPIPPYVRGSLWSYVLKTIVVILAALETYRLAGPIAARWAGLRMSTRWGVGLGVTVSLLAVALSMRSLAPDLFDGFSAEVGPWESITTACYACGLVLLWRVSGAHDEGMRRHLRLISAGFGLLLLEETDYGGIFGGLIGRVDGIYVGSLHDVIDLAAHGRLPALAVGGIGVASLVVTSVLWRCGYVKPRLIRGTLWSPGGIWLGLGFLFLLIAGVGEAGMLGRAFDEHSPEEAIEMAGGVSIGLFALQVAARASRPITRPADPRAYSPASADRIQLVDDDDARRGLLRAREEIPYTFRTDAHEQLHEVGAR